LDSYKGDFPSSAIPFFYQAPETELTRHIEAVSQFRRSLVGRGARLTRRYVAKQVTVIGGQSSNLRDAASRLAAILRKEGYYPTVFQSARELGQTFDDIEAFESVLSSELCVFVLGKELSYPDMLLAMAHAHCIPSVRLRYDPDAGSCAPELSGAVRWRSVPELVSSFDALLQNYQSAFS